MDLKEIRNFLGEDWKSVERYIETSLKSDIGLLDTTNKMILSHSGKQAQTYNFSVGCACVCRRFCYRGCLSLCRCSRIVA